MGDDIPKAASIENKVEVGRYGDEVDSIINEFQYLRVATGHENESLDEFVERILRRKGTTCLCFSFPNFVLLATDSRVTGCVMTTTSKIAVVNSWLQTKISRCGNAYESFCLIQDVNGVIERKRSHNGVIRACRAFHKYHECHKGYSCYVCSGLDKAHLVYYKVKKNGEKIHDALKLSMGFHGMGSGAYDALSELAYNFFGRRDIVIKDEDLKQYRVKGSEDLHINEEQAIKRAFEALYVTGLKDMNTGPPYEVHLFTREGPSDRQCLTFTDVCWRFWDVTKKLVCDKSCIFVFYPNALLVDDFWKEITTKYPFTGVSTHGHPLTFLKGSHVLQVVKFCNVASIETTMRHAVTSQVNERPEFLLENSDYSGIRTFTLTRTTVVNKKKRKVNSQIYMGRAGDNLLECLKEFNPQRRELYS